MASPIKRQGMGMMNALEGITDHPSKALPRQIPLDDIVADETIQVRVNGLSEDNLQRIQAVLENGGTIDEPIIVYETTDGLILADGFHRVEVHRRLNRPTILGVIRQGTYQDAVDFAEDANLKHGQPLTNDDKKSLLFRRLERGHDWQQASFESIGKALGVSRDTVRRWFADFSTRANAQVDRSKVLGADGKQRDMSKSIARNKAAVVRPVPSEDSDYPTDDTPEIIRPDYHALGRSRLTNDTPAASLPFKSEDIEQFRRYMQQLDTLFAQIAAFNPNDIAMMSDIVREKYIREVEDRRGNSHNILTGLIFRMRPK